MALKRQADSPKRRRRAARQAERESLRSLFHGERPRKRVLVNGVRVRVRVAWVDALHVCEVVFGPSQEREVLPAPDRVGIQWHPSRTEDPGG